MTSGSVVDQLFDVLPLSNAMTTLLAHKPENEEAVSLVAQADATKPTKAALWLYVDELDRAHQLVQDIDDETGSYLHAILHRREGDYSNSKYWFRRAGRHPILDRLGAYDPIAFVDLAQAGAHSNPPELIELQRREWQAIFDYLAETGR